MAEAIGAIASVMAIAACGVKLSRILYQTTTRTVNANDSINKIAMNVTLFSSTLSHLGRVLKETEMLQTQELIMTVSQLVERCQEVFDEITRLTTLSNNQASREKKIGEDETKTRRKMLKLIKCYFTKPTVEHLLAELEYLKTTLSVILNTLNLAALSAKMKQDQALLEASEQAREQAHAAEQGARMQVETLIVARQIAIIVLNQIVQHNTAMAADPGQVSKASGDQTPESDNELIGQSPKTKLLTNGPDPSTTLVKLNTRRLTFLDRGDPNAEELSPLMTAAPGYVDNLINRWIKPVEQTQLNEPEPESIPVRSGPPRDKAKAMPVDTATGTGKTNIGSDHMSDPSDQSWDIIPTPDIAESPSGPDDEYHALGIPLPLKAKRPIPKATAHSYQMVHAPGTSPTDSYQLTRKLSVPESDLPADQPMVHYQPDMHALQTMAPPTASHSQRNMSQRYQAPTDRDRPLRKASNNLGYYALPWYLPVPPGSNYKAPYVLSDEEESSDEAGDSPNGHKKRKDSVHSRGRKDTFESNADLEIPWRIRLSSSKYFDFVDERLVGPPAPFYPTERVSWIYSQDNACTEISKGWVSEAAISERKYKYSELRREEMQAADNSEGWRIMQSLKFREVEALVERTVELYEAHAAGKGPATPISPVTSNKSNLKPPTSTFQPGSPRNPSFISDANNARPEGGRRSPRNDGAFDPNNRRSPRPPGNGPFYAPQPSLRTLERERSHRERDRDRHYDSDEERDIRRRDERQRFKQRQDEERARRKKKTRSVTSTMAKIGGLAALLDGLEAALV